MTPVYFDAWHPGDPFFPDLRFIEWPADHISTNFAEFILDGDTPAISGDVVSAVPLPAALPLFGSGVMMLAGVAWRRRGKVS
jgi:hypothetical protein